MPGHQGHLDEHAGVVQRHHVAGQQHVVEGLPGGVADGLVHRGYPVPAAVLLQVVLEEGVLDVDVADALREDAVGLVVGGDDVPDGLAADLVVGAVVDALHHVQLLLGESCAEKGGLHLVCHAGVHQHGDEHGGGGSAVDAVGEQYLRHRQGAVALGIGHGVETGEGDVVGVLEPAAHGALGQAGVLEGGGDLPGVLVVDVVPDAAEQAGAGGFVDLLGLVGGYPRIDRVHHVGRGHQQDRHQDGGEGDGFEQLPDPVLPVGGPDAAEVGPEVHPVQHPEGEHGEGGREGDGRDGRLGGGVAAAHEHEERPDDRGDVQRRGDALPHLEQAVGHHDEQEPEGQPAEVRRQGGQRELAGAEYLGVVPVEQAVAADRCGVQSGREDSQQGEERHRDDDEHGEHDGPGLAGQGGIRDAHGRSEERDDRGSGGHQIPLAGRDVVHGGDQRAQQGDG